MKNQQAPTSNELITIIASLAQKEWVGVCARNEAHASAGLDRSIRSILRPELLTVHAEDVTAAGNWAKNWWIDVFRHQLARDALQLGAALSLVLSMDVRFGAVSRKDIFFDVWPASNASSAAAVLVAKGEFSLAMNVLIEHLITEHWAGVDEVAFSLDPDPSFSVIGVVSKVTEAVQNAGFKWCRPEDVYLRWLVKRITSQGRRES